MGIGLVAFWTVAAVYRSRRWVLRPACRQVLEFAAVGVVITVVMEWLATHALGRWAYTASMPTIPALEVGVSPLLQWVVLPPLIIWFVRRQLT